MNLPVKTKLHPLIAIAAMVLCSSSQADGPEPANSSSGGPIPVTIVEEQGRYTLMRGGEPYRIKGAGTNGGNLAQLAAHGANSLRNWRDPDSPDGFLILDEAAKYGLTVAMCLPVGRERHGFDYDDEEAVARQLEFARSEVLRYKDHPALLMWIIGNEPDLGYENPKVFDAINDISKMIHEVDGNHPTSTALSFSYSPELAAHVRERMPDLDILSVQKYADIVNLPRYIESAGIELPYLVTEYGPVGHWRWTRPPGAPRSNTTAATRQPITSTATATRSLPIPTASSVPMPFSGARSRNARPPGTACSWSPAKKPRPSTSCTMPGAGRGRVTGRRVLSP